MTDRRTDGWRRLQYLHRFFKKCLDNKAKPDDWREITLHKARTRITREHENNTITDAVPNEEHGVEPEEAESLLRRSQRIRR